MHELRLLASKKLAFTWWHFLLYFSIIIGALILLVTRPYFFHEPFHPELTNLIEKFAHDKDAHLRALAILAASSKMNDKTLGALIHGALLDKDPLVQIAAKLVIEEKFGIRLRNGADGIHQAHALLNDVGSSALIMKKGSP